MRAALRLTTVTTLSIVATGCGGSFLMRSARADLDSGNAGRAVSTLDLEMRRDGNHEAAEKLRREAATTWAHSEIGSARLQGPNRLFSVANQIGDELNKRKLFDVTEAEVKPAIAEALAGVWAAEVEAKVKANRLEEAVAAGEAIVANAPADAKERGQLLEIRTAAARKHADLLTKVPTNAPGALLMHIRMARRYGVEWKGAAEEEAQLRIDANPRWQPLNLKEGECPELAQVLRSKLKVSPMFFSGVGPEASVEVSLTGCPTPSISKTWTTQESKPYAKVTTVTKYHEDKRYETRREYPNLVTYEITKRTPYEVSDVQTGNEVVDVLHVQVQTSATATVLITWGGHTVKKNVNVKHNGESMSWKGELAGEGAYNVMSLAPLTSLTHLLWLQMGFAMGEAYQTMSQDLQAEAEKLLAEGKTIESEDRMMMASLMNRSLSGDNTKITDTTRKYLADTYGIAGPDARTVMLGDPLQKPKAPSYGAPLTLPGADPEAVRWVKEND